jgi:hypothetical protein
VPCINNSTCSSMFTKCLLDFTQKISRYKFTNKNAPAMMGAFKTHHRKIYVGV